MKMPKVTKEKEVVKRTKKQAGNEYITTETRDGVYKIETSEGIKEEKYHVEIEGDVNSKALLKFETLTEEGAYRGEISREVIRKEGDNYLIRIKGYTNNAQNKRKDFDFQIAVPANDFSIDDWIEFFRNYDEQ